LHSSLLQAVLEQGNFWHMNISRANCSSIFNKQESCTIIQIIAWCTLSI